MSTLADLEARVAALEASQADYRAVLAAVNALGVNQRDMNETLRDHGRRLETVEVRLTRVESKLDDTNTRVRSLEETTGEIKELLIRSTAEVDFTEIDTRAVHRTRSRPWSRSRRAS